MEAILISVKWYIIMLLIYISLMACDVENPFLCLSILCMSSLEKCLFKTFAHFFNWVVCLPVVESCECSSLYILEIKPLFEMSLANIFSHRIGSLFVLLMFSSAVQKLFNLIKSPLFIFFLYVPCSRGYIGENIASWNICSFPTYVLLYEF